jgi:hypothetical protein
MAISRAQMYRQLKNKGGITNLIEPRQQYGLGSLVKSITKPIKKAASAIGDFASSDVGKLALLAAGGYYAGGGNLFGLQRAGMSGFAFGNLPGAALFAKSAPTSKFLYSPVQGSGGMGVLGKAGLALAGGTALAALAGGVEEGDPEAIAASRDVNALKGYLRSYYENLGYEPQAIERLVARDTKEYSEGRGGYADGGMPTGIMRTNQAGVMERDYREQGGFVPVGIKEKADDVPAMLSKNEFVFTADAVRGAGNGDVEKGAQRMYKVMKTLENGGTV